MQLLRCPGSGVMCLHSSSRFKLISNALQCKPTSLYLRSAGDTGRDKTSLCGWCLPNKEAQIAACVHKAKATLDSNATSEACCMCCRQLALLAVSLVLTTYHFINKMSAGLYTWTEAEQPCATGVLMKDKEVAMTCKTTFQPSESLWQSAASG